MWAPIEIFIYVTGLGGTASLSFCFKASVNDWPLPCTALHCSIDPAVLFCSRSPGDGTDEDEDEGGSVEGCVGPNVLPEGGGCARCEPNELCDNDPEEEGDDEHHSRRCCLEAPAHVVAFFERCVGLNSAKLNGAFVVVLEILQALGVGFCAWLECLEPFGGEVDVAL